MSNQKIIKELGKIPDDDLDNDNNDETEIWRIIDNDIISNNEVII